MKNSSADGKKILLLEDEPVISQMCQRALISEGFEVDIAINGEIAQDMLRGKTYDLCLIDIRTPIMNGEQLYRYMKEKHPELTNRVIFTTGDVMNGDIQSFMEQTDRAFLLKPFAPDELITIIRETLKEIEK